MLMRYLLLLQFSGPLIVMGLYGMYGLGAAHAFVGTATTVNIDVNTDNPYFT